MIFEAVQRPRGNGAEQTAGAPWIRYRGAPHPFRPVTGRTRGRAPQAHLGPISSLGDRGFGGWIGIRTPRTRTGRETGPTV